MCGFSRGVFYVAGQEDCTKAHYVDNDIRTGSRGRLHQTLQQAAALSRPARHVYALVPSSWPRDDFHVYRSLVLGQCLNAGYAQAVWSSDPGAILQIQCAIDKKLYTSKKWEGKKCWQRWER